MPIFSPPRALFIWPEVVRVERGIVGVESHAKHLAVDAAVLVYTAGSPPEAWP